MHPSLELQNMSRLPPSLRRLAVAAAKGSIDDLKKISATVENVSSSTAVLFLPAFYVNLEPGPISGISDVDAADLDREQFSCALECIEGLYHSQSSIPAAAVPDLWPRYWAWIRFFRLCMVKLQFDDENEDELCRGAVKFMAHFSNDNAAATLMAATGGTRAVIVRAWSSIVRRGDPRERHSNFESLMPCLLGPMNATDSTGLEEYMDAAGGGLDDLSFLIVETINLLVPATYPKISPRAIDIVGNLLVFIIRTDHSHSEDRRRISSALRLRGLTKALTTLLCNLAESTDTPSNHVLHDTFTLIGQGFEIQHTCLVQALNCGLLQALLACGTHPPSSRVHAHLNFMFGAILPMSLAYHTVVDRVDAALTNITDWTSPLVETDTFQSFLSLTARRLNILKELRTNKFSLFGTCDNMQCCSNAAKKNFKRCSVCKNAYYCSAECQSVDWRWGGHRDMCSDRATLFLTEDSDLAWRDRVFFRAILQRDYKDRMTTNVYPAQALFMSKHPDDFFFTLFDYTMGHPKIHVDSALHSAIGQELSALGSEWESTVSRSLENRGRLELHVMSVVKSGKEHYFLIPFRMKSSKLFDGLKRIAAEISPELSATADQEGFIALMKDVEALVEEQRDDMTMH